MLHTIQSMDGTSIGFDQSGRGSPLVLVHGTGGDRSRYTLVLPDLSQHFTVFAVDRRGRGSSGDVPDAYSIEREYEDIAAVASAAVEITGCPVDVLGHSFGAACVLGAAKLIPCLNRLVLYEPPMLREQQTPARTQQLERMETALAAGDREAVVVILMHEMLGVQMAGIDRVKSMPAWANSLSAAPTIPRELRVSDAYGVDLEAFRSITAKTLFLLGSASPASFKVTTETLCSHIPNSQVALLPNQQHSAMLTAPDLFSSEVVKFLKG